MLLLFVREELHLSQSSEEEIQQLELSCATVTTLQECVPAVAGDGKQLTELRVESCPKNTGQTKLQISRLFFFCVVLECV